MDYVPFRYEVSPPRPTEADFARWWASHQQPSHEVTKAFLQAKGFQFLGGKAVAIRPFVLTVVEDDLMIHVLT